MTVERVFGDANRESGATAGHAKFFLRHVCTEVPKIDEATKQLCLELVCSWRKKPGIKSVLNKEGGKDRNNEGREENKKKEVKEEMVNIKK